MSLLRSFSLFSPSSTGLSSGLFRRMKVTVRDVWKKFPHLLTAMEDQAAHELENHLMYLSMAYYFANENLPGMANWMHVQSEEERIHMSKLMDFISERGRFPKLRAIPPTPADWKSPQDVFERAYDREVETSDRINELMSMANESKDYATAEFLRWFVTEQVEEEATTLAIAERLENLDEKHLILIDQELAKRQFVPPPTTTN
eukprot:TRINITY_DN81137_c0_g1_i1.p1 TRINITY_DN81137_c0_g1~~TRINITY_DN81137_c0_g1_i1.p1  ORF type:complete len:203 (+),score=60.49 TRINITY_DN81137_c0_g1_i1:64-672(+)